MTLLGVLVGGRRLILVMVFFQNLSIFIGHHTHQSRVAKVVYQRIAPQTRRDESDDPTIGSPKGRSPGHVDLGPLSC